MRIMRYGIDHSLELSILRQHLQLLRLGIPYFYCSEKRYLEKIMPVCLLIIDPRLQGIVREHHRQSSTNCCPIVAVKSSTRYLPHCCAATATMSRQLVLVVYYAGTFRPLSSLSLTAPLLFVWPAGSRCFRCGEL